MKQNEARLFWFTSTVVTGAGNGLSLLQARTTAQNTIGLSRVQTG